MKKTLLLFITIAGFLTSFLSAESSVSDVVIFNEINLAYKNAYYPGTVDKVNLLVEAFPDSVFIQPALAYKGDALTNMGQYDEAIETLNQAISHMHTGSKEITHCTYLLGKTYYFKKDYPLSLNYLHKAASLALTDKDMEYYNPSILYSAKIYYLLEDFKSAYPLYEYVIQNGKAYSQMEYVEALQKLMLSYNRCGLYAKTLNLFDKLNKEDFSEELYLTLSLYRADALKGMNRNLEAYQAYCQVLECDYEYLAVIALKKAYILASEKNIGVNPGQVFEKSVDTFKSNPQLVQEFWLRLGIDEYNLKHYDKALEYFAQVSEKDGEESPLITFYKARILLDSDKAPDQAEKLLLTIDEEKVKQAKEENFQDSYYSLLLQCKFQQKKWKELASVYNKIQNPDDAAVYALSSAYYELGDYKKVADQTGLLYASSLCKLGDYYGAVKAFEKLSLSPEYKAEYAKALFACGFYQEAYKQAQASNYLHKEYIMGLCLINQKDWSQAQKHFANYIKQTSGKENFISLAFFYKGYAEYCLEEYKNAYASFVRYSTEPDTDQPSYIRKAYEYAAKSALQNGDFKNASIQAENVIRTSANQSDKEAAVLFCADILSDYQSYDRALSILQPYTQENSDFALQAIFASAGIYEKKGDVESADLYYQKIYKDNPASSFAEEAMFRTGGLYYSCQDYSTALGRFNNYIYKYVNGRFVDAAFFFGGDCALKLGEIDRAILLNVTLLQKYKDSIYSYGANKNLLAAYYEQEAYNQALEVAKVMLRDFPDQAADDEIGSRKIELEKIVSGSSKQVAEKESDYEKQGKSSTKKGRIIGSELVKLYAESPAGQEQAFKLARELLAKQTDPDEKKYAAENAEFIADYYRRKEENQKAAEMYLTAAQYYRSLEDSSRAAACLYGAAEAFAVQGLLGDAGETAGLLKELYPDSRQAQRVDSLLE
ncbi:MAG: hypothetical protein K6C97_10535 [Treponema sp.]|nr:hypothetical protein [Treponema sp.]